MVDKNFTLIKRMCYEIPKAELHVHIEGTLEPDMMFSIAKRNNIELPYKSVKEIKEKYNFKNLNDFLEIYYEASNILRKEEDFEDLCFSYLEKVSTSHGVKYAEMFFDPQSHTSRGVSFNTIVQGLTNGIKKAKLLYDIDAKLIMCFLRHLSEDDAIQTLNEALKLKSEFIIGVGLDSGEIGNPPDNFINVYKMAKDNGLKLCAHAGEEGPWENIKKSIEMLGVERIDHGVRIYENEDLFEKCSQTQIPFTVCPLSYKSLSYSSDFLKFRRMLEGKLLICVNSDDPAYFGGYIGDNYAQFIKTNQEDKWGCDLTIEEVIQLAKNSFKATFLDNKTKEEYLKSVDEYVSLHI